MALFDRRRRSTLASLTPRLTRLRLETYAATPTKRQYAPLSPSVECTRFLCNCIMLTLLGRTHLDRELFEAILSLPTTLEALYLVFASASPPLPLPCSSHCRLHRA